MNNGSMDGIQWFIYNFCKLNILDIYIQRYQSLENQTKNPCICNEVHHSTLDAPSVLFWSLGFGQEEKNVRKVTGTSFAKPYKE